MKYMLLMYWNPEQAQKPTGEDPQVVAEKWYSFNREAQAAGVLLSTNGLAAITDATTVRVRDGKVLTTDGPYAETHEQLGGYYLLDCKDLDDAIQWASKIPAAENGSIEIRPLWSGAQ